MDTVTLKNGIEAHAGLVTTVMMYLNNWSQSGLGGMLIAYDAVAMARDSNYKPFGQNGEKLREAGFIDPASSEAQPRLHRSIADILKCAAQGEGTALRFVDPRAS